MIYDKKYIEVQASSISIYENRNDEKIEINQSGFKLNTCILFIIIVFIHWFDILYIKNPSKIEYTIGKET